MAFSMFLRSTGAFPCVKLFIITACPNRIFSQQMMRMATQSSMTLNQTTSVLAKGVISKQATTTPIINPLRSFRTSPLLRSGAKGDHSKLWVVEKAVTVALVPLIPLALLAPNKLFDSLLAILVTAHSFWGLEAIAVDYVRASVVGPILPKVTIGLVYLISIATLGGLFYLISHDIGLANTVKQLWAVKSSSENKA